MDTQAVALRARERAEFVATLRQVGPGSPTLCTGWSAADVAAHIAVSEQALGVPMFVFNSLRRVAPARLTRRAIEGAQGAGDRLIARMRAQGWNRVLSRLENGPPKLYRYGTLADLRFVEEWIHHEDVRRGAGLPRRSADPDFEAALGRAGISVSRFPEFKLGREGIELNADDGRRFAVGDGSARIHVSGPVGELLLYLAGRGDAAEVTVQGDVEDIASVQPALRV